MSDQLSHFSEKFQYYVIEHDGEKFCMEVHALLLDHIEIMSKNGIGYWVLSWALGSGI